METTEEINELIYHDLSKIDSNVAPANQTQSPTQGQQVRCTDGVCYDDKGQPVKQSAQETAQKAEKTVDDKKESVEKQVDETKESV